jgi:hypothetical protein
MPAEAKPSFLADIRTAQAATRAGVTTQYSDRRDKAWDIWTTFCRSLCQDRTLRNIPHPVHLLQVFATRMRDGRIAPVVNPSGMAPYLPRSVMWARRLPSWGPRTLI